MNAPEHHTEPVLGIGFFDGSAREAVEQMTRRGGYLVVPAAPALVNICYDEQYRRALTRADMAIADSGFMVLLWRLIQGRALNRISGLLYLRMLLENRELREAGALFVVVPTETAREHALVWFRSQNFALAPAALYVAPVYGAAVRDAELLRALTAARPRHILIGLGGGTQERLGLYLRDHVDYRPAIHCVGAALGFLTGDQQAIPDWADRLYVGWLLRLARNPRAYFRRFWVAHELPGLIKRYGPELPPLRQKLEKR